MQWALCRKRCLVACSTDVIDAPLSSGSAWLSNLHTDAALLHIYLSAAQAGTAAAWHDCRQNDLLTPPVQPSILCTPAARLLWQASAACLAESVHELCCTCLPLQLSEPGLLQMQGNPAVLQQRLCCSRCTQASRPAIMFWCLAAAVAARGACKLDPFSRPSCGLHKHAVRLPLAPFCSCLIKQS